MNRRDEDSILHCRHFGICGGCSRLDQPIRWQLQEKVENCERVLAPFLSGQRIAWREPRRTPRWFRTRLLYPVRVDRDKLPIAGLYTYRTNDLVRIEECQTGDRWLTELGRAMEAVLRDFALAPYRARSGKGYVKAVWARLASGTGEVIAGIVTRPGVFALPPAMRRRVEYATTEGCHATRTCRSRVPWRTAGGPDRLCGKARCDPGAGVRVRARGDAGTGR